MKLIEALRLAPDACIALVGAGGKSSTMFTLARDLSSPVFLAATTHLSQAQLTLADQHFIVETLADVAAVLDSGIEGVMLFTGCQDSNGKMQGIRNDIIERLLVVAKKYKAPFIIEADGSRQLPLKAPADHEPALPFIDSGRTTGIGLDAVVVVAGLSGLGKPLSADWVHRYERFGELSGLNLGDTITTQALVKVLLHPSGGLKRIPPGTRRVLMLNQADSAALQSQAQGIAHRLIKSGQNPRGYHAVLITSVKSYQVHAVHEPIAGVVLAAGEASRFGKPKQLLDWQGEPLVRRTSRIAIEAGLDPVVVVVGAYAELVQSSLNGLDVRLVFNPDWSEGMSTSVKRGVMSLPAYSGGVVFMLVDQPFIQLELIRLLIENHSMDMHPIVGPLAGGRRGNPVLFDQVTFPDLLMLEGDRGGRQLFSKYSPTWIPWHDERILHEIDTPEDYMSLQQLLL